MLLLLVVVTDVSLGKSVPHFVSSYPLLMIREDVSLLENTNAQLPSRMEVSSGKSIHHSHWRIIALKSAVLASIERALVKVKCFQFGQVYLSFPLHRIYPSVSMKQTRMTNQIQSILSCQSLPGYPHSQSHTLYNH